MCMMTVINIHVMYNENKVYYRVKIPIYIFMIKK